MKAVEDISESLNSLSQVISMSFMFAKSSPMKAKKSLMTCAEYLQSKTFKSTSFVIRFWLVLIDLLKNENVEILILTLLSMLQNVISLLKSKEVQTIITAALKLAGSEPVTKLMLGVTKCVKSLFYIIKTPEIAKFQKQIWELIEDEEKKEKEKENEERQRRRSQSYSRGSQVPIPGMGVIEEGNGYYNEDEEAQYTNIYDEDGNYIAPSRSNSNSDNDNEHEEESKLNENDDDNVSTATNKSNTSTSYYSPVRAWYGLTSIPSMVFGGYNQESDRSQDDDSDEDGIAGIDNGVDHNNRQSLCNTINIDNIDNKDKDIEESESKQDYEPLPDHSSSNLLNGRQRRSKSVTSIGSMRSNKKVPLSRRTLSYDGNKNMNMNMNGNHYNGRYPYHGQRNGMMNNNGYIHNNNGMQMNMNPNMNMNNNGNMSPSQTMSTSGSVTINDWVSLIHYIDELEDNGDISINEGDEMRKLAMEERMALLIIFKCYHNKQSRFIRYARNILNDEKKAKLLKDAEKQQKNGNNNDSQEITVSLDDVKVNNIDSNNNNNNNIKVNDNDIDDNINGDGDIVCID